MKTTQRILILPLLLLLLAPAISGQTPSSKAAPAPSSGSASAGLANDWLRQQSPAWRAWDLGGQVRLRLEHKEHFAAPGVPGAVDFRRTGGNEDNTYLLLREKVHAGYAPRPWLTAFVEGRDSSSQKDDRNPNPEADQFDLHQAHLTLGNPKEFPLTAKVGRQELVYGDERVVGAFDWSNVGRVFDAAKLRFENPDIWVDGFVGRVVLVDDNSFNEANDYDTFSGLYASTKTLIPKQETQLYLLSRNVGPGSPTASPRDIYTIGLRVKSLPGQLGGWDYEAELAGQFGRYKFAAAGPSLDHEAFAAHIAGGYTCTKTTLTPRLGLEYNYASGDGNPADGEHGTFENLFPTNHKFYGYMDFVSWQNMHNARLTSSIKPVKKLTVTADYHAFWLADTADAFYQVNGASRGGVNAAFRGVAASPNPAIYGANPAYGSYVGSEVDLIGTYALKPYAALQAGYGHFFVGNYVKDSLAGSGGAADADYVYLQLVFNF